MLIIGRATARYDDVAARLPAGTHGRFAGEMMLPLWRAADKYGLDPVGIVAQSLKETGNGNFGGQVTPQFYNTCGLKVRHLGKYPGVDDGDRPLAHQQFPSWEVGALAHAQHIRAYINWPVQDTILSPRYLFVIDRYRLDHWYEFGGGKWAPAATYGQEVETIIRRLQGR